MNTKGNPIHGMCRSAEYRTWSHMKDRCNNPNDKRYHCYGGRGIKICDAWNNSFESFFTDMGERPEGMTIDRIDNNGDYEPSNCRWASTKTQCNNKRTNRMFTYNGKTQTMQQWADEYNLPLSTLKNRIDNFNYSFEDALLTKSHQRKRKAIALKEHDNEC